ncbi:RDD family protein [Ornithinimicrobium sp. INDO-MA30-4]|uniref:RDD family protein n=1 Tax=Ornithinimicrobium sp. INDO-MA30-4 TaxID=2908651 RepID=UPI001F172A36|nr:RDD family protein [Ornithinimicrobium sp. INDO-MA30-4]UJH70367.1 RDD family protein [Ornithinimicrobium sp. INDO-MA30-4]
MGNHQSFWLRRLVATGIDNSLIFLPLGASAAVNLVRHRADGRALEAPGSVARIVVPLALTIPFALGLGFAESCGGTPGKRMMGLEVVGEDGSPVSVRQHLVRACLKTALPWELGHQSVWEFTAGRSGRGALLSGAAHVIVIAQAIAAASGAGRTPADRIAGTVVRHRQSTRSGAHVS